MPDPNFHLLGPYESLLNIQAQLDVITGFDGGAAPLASPTFTGVPAAPTAAPGTNTTQISTTAFVFAGLALKANLASPTFSGTPSLPTGTIAVTQSPSDNSTKIATTAYADAGDALALPLSKVRHYRSPSFTALASATNSGTQTINWASPFADNNYTVIATVEINESSSFGAVTSIVCVATVEKQAAGAGVIVDISNADSIPHTWKLNLIGIHD